MHPKPGRSDLTSLKDPINLYKSIINAASVALVLVDSKGTIIFYNNEFKNIFNHVSGSENFSQLLPESIDNPNSVCCFDKNQKEFRIKTDKHGNSTVSVSFKNILSVTEKEYYLGTATIEKHYNDVSLLQQLIDRIPDSIFIKDLDSRFILANNWIAKIMGVASPNDLIGKNDFDFYPKQLAQKYLSDEKQVILSGKPMLNMLEKVIVNGKIKWYSTTKMPLYNTYGKISGIMGVGRDISQNVLEAKALKKAKKDAEKADKLKSAFLANLSHEIRTPLNGILGFSQFLKQKPHPEEKQHKYLDIIHANGIQLLMLINDIIDISMIESNQILIKNQSLQLNPFLYQLKPVFEQQIAQKKLDIKLNINPCLPDGQDIIITDEFRLKQILNNLISNALKFTSEGEITIGYKLEDNVLVFSVSDTGIGIEPQHQKEIFERFRQVDESITKTYSGTGLGLSICKGLINLLGGNIWVKSKPGNGSTFYFSLPYKQNIQEFQHEKIKNVAVL